MLLHILHYCLLFISYIDGEDGDYLSVNENIILVGNPSESGQCFDVHLLYDDRVEMVEMFTIRLSSDDRSLFITHSDAAIHILDNTSKLL